MDNMLGENKSPKNTLKDIKDMPVPFEVFGLQVGSYAKTKKLITALYMITDIMDREEPLRNKLRSLGANIISDIYRLKGQASFYPRLHDLISETLSFLDIASGIGIVSEMNSNIITKEFIELRNSIMEFTTKKDQKWLEEFIKEEEEKTPEALTSLTRVTLAKGQTRTRIGVQRGSTLLKALSNVEGLQAGGFGTMSDRTSSLANRNNNNEQKNKRREEIITIIKDKGKDNPGFDGVTITDIKSIGQGVLASCGEKTLQRELVSMVSDGLLIKTGSKRWSKYSLKV
jgi:hypothetical protein